MQKSPFKFLDSYTLSDRDVFFGRDQEISELYRKVFEGRTLLVYGVSGTGKSSLINCGLASRFDESDWLPVNVRRGNNIVSSLEAGLVKNALTSFKEQMSITEKIQSLYLDHFKPVYLVFDQFEELFIFGYDDEKSTFIRLIKEVTVSKVQCRILFIIREEFLAGITEFEDDLPEIFANRFRVERMKRSNAINAIEGPCRVSEISTEPGFAEEMIGKLCPGGNEIELTYLQIYLDRIYNLAVSDQGNSTGLTFSTQLLSGAGSVADLLGQFLDEQIREMDDPETGMAVLKSFVSVQGTKRQMNEEDLTEALMTFGKGTDKVQLEKYLEKFVELRILRERDESGHFELRHDALAAKIYQQYTISEKELLDVRHFIGNAYLTFRSRGTYLNSEDLEYISEFEKRLFLPEELNRFVNYSKEQLFKQQRALRRLTLLAAAGFLLFIAAGLKFYINKKGSVEVRDLTSLALLQEKTDPLAAINTAYKVESIDSTSTIIKGVAFRSFADLLERETVAGDTKIPESLLPMDIPVSGKVLAFRKNRTGTAIYGWTNKKEVFFSDLNGQDVSSFRVQGPVIEVQLSDDSQFAAIIDSSGNGSVYTTGGQGKFTFPATVNDLNNSRLVRFFPEGNNFIAVVKDSGALIYDTAGICRYTLSGHQGRVNSLDISPDGRFVATASCDKTCLIWNYNNKTGYFSPYDTLVAYRDFLNLYQKADSMLGQRDTIWSCEFNSTGKYILTASADSTINIWNLYGRLINIIFIYGVHHKEGMKYYTPMFNKYRLWKDYERNPDLMSYYNKVCDASFTEGEGGVITSNYSRESALPGILRRDSKSSVFYYDGNYLIATSVPENKFIELAKEQGLNGVVPLNRILAVSPDLSIFAAVPFDKDIINLIMYDGYTLASLKGSFPLFAERGRYLFYVNNRRIIKLPLFTRDIYFQVIQKQIFGDPSESDDFLKVI